MSEKFTVTQLQRLAELNGDTGCGEMEFADAGTRNKAFMNMEKELTEENRKALSSFLGSGHITAAVKAENDLTGWLTDEEGFSKVSTPIMIPGEYLDRMTITKDHALREQVFWVGKNKCMRPMLAPNLYIVMRELHKITGGPVKIFECGSCFRKESQGAMHMNEFTMLNLVELAGTEEGKQSERLEGFAHDAMKAVGIDKYDIVKEKSEVYGETLDIVADGVEIASGAYGPMALDAPWGIFDVWVGIGLGIERIAMIKGEYKNIKRVGKSTTFVDGIPLKL
ncbi:MAG: pyrrolysine--tRNA(Pyl) ligase large subunit [Eubacteriaceae bacterium]|nr:pyrrolysine--tRNA(Pyl) ligase large subunit [Eubacteriaceae bacterium]